MSCSEWKEYRLEDICENIFSGGTPSTKNTNYWNGSIPWLSSGETRNNFINSTEKTITLDGVNNSSTKLAKKGDIVIASAGQGYTRGQTSFCNIDTYINQSLIAIRTNNAKIHNKYLYYNLKGRYDELRQLSDGHSIRGSLTTKIIKDLVIKLPSLEEQEKIANILSSLDDKIELNNEMNKTLEEMDQSIFKRWFVDFEFPNEDGQPYKSSGGEMVESELGMIPKEWKIGTLDNIGTFKNGKKIKSELRDDNGKYIIYGSNGIIGKTNEVLQNNNCIILGRVGAYCGSVQLSLEPCWITDNAIMATSKEEKYLPYLHRFLLNYPLRESAGGSAQPLINQGILKSIITTIPTQNLFEKYYNISKEILSKIDKNIKENNLLAEIRDSILPKLMSNEISI